MPVVGTEQTVTLARADTLLHLARQYNTDPLTLARLNPLYAPRPNAPAADMVKAATRLKLPSREILPLCPRDGIVLNIPERGLYVFEDGQLLARYPAAVGQATWQTPTGAFRIVRLEKDPVWLPPREMVRREGTKFVKVPPGPNNPLGDRWIGWSAPQIGFHSTWIVASVGQAASHGCVRMYPESAHQLFDLVDVGTPIYAVYTPVKVGRDGRNIYISVSPDIYHRGLATLAQAQKRLHEAGLNHADPAQLKRIVREQDGFPHFVGALVALPAPPDPARSAVPAPSPLNAADSLLRPTDMEGDTGGRDTELDAKSDQAETSRQK